MCIWRTLIGPRGLITTNNKKDIKLGWDRFEVACTRGNCREVVVDRYAISIISININLLKLENIAKHSDFNKILYNKAR